MSLSGSKLDKILTQKDLQEVQREFPSIIEELFEIALLRLNKAIKLRKDAIM